MARIILIAAIIVGLAAFALDVRSRSRGGESMPHTYNAPHGGTIIRLGRHEAHLELVLDPASGRLTAYLLGPAAKNPIGARSQSFDLAITDGEARTLTFNAVPDPAINSTAADATRFEAHADWLKRDRRFKGQLTMLKIGSTTFLHLPVEFPAGNEKP